MRVQGVMLKKEMDYQNLSTQFVEEDFDLSMEHGLAKRQESAFSSFSNCLGIEPDYYQ